MKARPTHGCFAIFLAAVFFSSVVGEAAQKELQKLTVGYTPISGATLPFFIAVEEKLFQKYGFEIAPVFMGGSPLINSAILAGEFPIGYTGGGAIISSRLAGSDLIAIACPLPVLTIDAWARPESRCIHDRISVWPQSEERRLSPAVSADGYGIWALPYRGDRDARVLVKG